MFWKRICINKKKCKNIVPSKHVQFNEVMSFVWWILNTEDGRTNKEVLLDYILSVVKADLISEYIADVFYKPEPREWGTIFPLRYYNEVGEEICLDANNKVKCVDLAKDDVVMLPWDKDRMANAIKNVFKNKFRYRDNNHFAMYFTDIEMCYVYNGIHHTAAGVVLKNGIIEAKGIDISQTFKHIKADAENWYNAHTGEVLLKMCDFRLGVIYEIVRIKKEL